MSDFRRAKLKPQEIKKLASFERARQANFKGA